MLILRHEPRARRTQLRGELKLVRQNVMTAHADFYREIIMRSLNIGETASR